jgi:hypothetical protein
MNLKVLQVTITDFINQENVGNLSDGAGWVEWRGRPIVWSSVIWCLLIDVLKISLGHQRRRVNAGFLREVTWDDGQCVQQPSEGFLLFFALQNIGLRSYTSKWGHFQSNQEIQHKRVCKHQRHCGVSDHGCKQQFDLILHVYGIGELYDKASECDPAMQLCEYS